MNSLYHSYSSAKAFGGEPEDYIEVHNFFDQSRHFLFDPRHRMALHHSFGCYLACQHFGDYLTNSWGRKVPILSIAKQHIQEDLGCIPTLQDWAELITKKPWVSPRSKLLFKKANLDKYSSPSTLEFK